MFMSTDLLHALGKVLYRKCSQEKERENEKKNALTTKTGWKKDMLCWPSERNNSMLQAHYNLINNKSNQAN